MIERYSDHAANERTFLAWVRTAIAIITFGFFVEKFDLFVAYSRQAAGAAPASAGHPWMGDAAGLALVALGGSTMVVAAIRFRRTAREIDRRETVPGPGARADLSLATLLLLLAAALFVYLSYDVLSRA